MSIKLRYPIIISILLLGWSCSQNDPLAPSEIADSGPSFLLVSESDPLELESDPAFMMDGSGPLFLGVLNLGDEQKEQIRRIAAGYRDDFRALRARWRNGASWREIREQRRMLREEMHSDIISVLTPEQQAVIQDIQDQLANGIYPDILINKRLAFLTELLTLSQTQQDTIRPLLAQAGTDMLAARENSSNIRELREALRNIFEELDQQIVALLSAEQLEIYNTWKAERFRRRHRFPGRR